MLVVYVIKILKNRIFRLREVRLLKNP
jgi:hypothetical protein